MPSFLTFVNTQSGNWHLFELWRLILSVSSALLPLLFHSSFIFRLRLESAFLQEDVMPFNAKSFLRTTIQPLGMLLFIIIFFELAIVSRSFSVDRIGKLWRESTRMNRYEHTCEFIFPIRIQGFGVFTCLFCISSVRSSILWILIFRYVGNEELLYSPFALFIPQYPISSLRITILTPASIMILKTPKTCFCICHPSPPSFKKMIVLDWWWWTE